MVEDRNPKTSIKGIHARGHDRLAADLHSFHDGGAGAKTAPLPLADTFRHDADCDCPSCVDNRRYCLCGSCGGRGYVPDDPEKGPDACRPCRDCYGEGHRLKPPLPLVSVGQGDFAHDGNGRLLDDPAVNFIETPQTRSGEHPADGVMPAPASAERKTGASSSGSESTSKEQAARACLGVNNAREATGHCLNRNGGGSAPPVAVLDDPASKAIAAHTTPGALHPIFANILLAVFPPASQVLRRKELRTRRAVVDALIDARDELNKASDGFGDSVFGEQIAGHVQRIRELDPKACPKCGEETAESFGVLGHPSPTGEESVVEWCEHPRDCKGRLAVIERECCGGCGTTFRDGYINATDE